MRGVSPAISSVPRGRGLRAHGWGARVYSHALGQAHSALRLGHFHHSVHIIVQII